MNELSGGQQQCFFLARTFAQGTPFILMDEPANHLDLCYQKELMNIVSGWRSGSMGSIHNTVSAFHDLFSAVDNADELIFMKEGRIVKAGISPEKITSSLLTEVYDMDVAGEMKRRDSFWQEMNKEKRQR